MGKYWGFSDISKKVFSFSRKWFKLKKYEMLVDSINAMSMDKLSCGTNCHPGILGLKPLGGSKVNSALHPSKVVEMSSRNS